MTATDELHIRRARGVFACPSCKASRHHFVRSDDGAMNSTFVCAECGHVFKAMTPKEAHQRRLERQRAYYAAHREEILAKRHEKRMANLEEEREKERLYRKKNAKRINELNRAWRDGNIEQERERCRRYWAEHSKEINLRRNIVKLYSGKWGAK